MNESCEYRLPDWKPIGTDEFSNLSHGHMIEFAWLLLHAQQALGIPLDWDHFESLLRHSLRYGFDHDRGGFYFRGKPHEPACDTTKYLVGTGRRFVGPDRCCSALIPMSITSRSFS